MRKHLLRYVTIFKRRLDSDETRLKAKKNLSLARCSWKTLIKSCFTTHMARSETKTLNVVFFKTKRKPFLCILQKPTSKETLFHPIYSTLTEYFINYHYQTLFLPPQKLIERIVLILNGALS